MIFNHKSYSKHKKAIIVITYIRAFLPIRIKSLYICRV